MKNEKITISYQETVDNECTAIINELLLLLPDYCAAFNLSRQGTTQIRSRKENLKDIKIFFTFLIARNPILSNKGMKNIPASALEMLKVEDFDDYEAWLHNYTMMDENGKLKEYKNSDVGVKRKLSSVRALYKFLYNREYINSNPCAKKDMPKLPKKNASTTRILEKDEREPFFTAVENEYAIASEKVEQEISIKGKAYKRTLLLPAIAIRNKAIILVLLATGMRLSELCGIDCTDYSKERATINITRKGGKLDRVYLSDKAQEALDNYLDNYRYQFKPNNKNYEAMFLSERGSRITTRAVELMVKYYANKALGTNNGISPHRLRATFGTEYYLQTKDIKATASAMGHDSMQTTATYYVRDDDKAKEQAKNIVF